MLTFPLAYAPLAPSWLVMPMAGLTLLVVASHVLSLGRAPMPPSRRRLRLANGIIMMLAIPIGAFALGMADPRSQPREFTMAWMLLTGLLLIVLLVAVADIFNNWRLARIERRRINAELWSRPQEHPGVSDNPPPIQ